MNYSDGAAWMDGRIIPISEASIGVTDWGLTRSDITYDVVHVFDGAFFRLDDYLTRFGHSIAGLRLNISQTPGEMRQILHDIVAASGLRSAYCSVVASRGKPSIPGTRDPRLCNNHFYAWCVPFVHVIPEEIARRGAHLLVAETARRIPPDSVDPTIKNYHWGDLTRAQFEALDNGYNTAVLTDHNGNITEGPGFNVFAVIAGRVVTPNSGALEGITRKTVLEICEELGIPASVEPVSAEAFVEADEIFTATTAGGPVPVTRVNQRILSNDAPGPVSTSIRDAYWQWHNRPQFRDEISYPQ